MKPFFVSTKTASAQEIATLLDRAVTLGANPYEIPEGVQSVHQYPYCRDYQGYPFWGLDRDGDTYACASATDYIIRQQWTLEGAHAYLDTLVDAPGYKCVMGRDNGEEVRVCEQGQWSLFESRNTRCDPFVDVISQRQQDQAHYLASERDKP